MLSARLSLVLALVLGLTALSSQTEAARRKAKRKAGEQVHSGVVQSVNHKTGSFTIRTAHHHKKRTAAVKVPRTRKALARRSRANHHHGNHTFHVTPATRFQGGSFKTMKRGEHVVVLAQGQRAADVKLGRGNARPKRKRKI